MSDDYMLWLFVGAGVGTIYGIALGMWITRRSFKAMLARLNEKEKKKKDWWEGGVRP